jgi:hypothetical protein
MNKIFSLILVVAFLLFLPWSAQAADSSCYYWVAPNGSDANPGTVSQPWATLEHASETVPDNFCTVWFEPGVYYGAHRLNRRFDTPTLFRARYQYRSILEFSGAVVSISGGKNISLAGFDIRHSGLGAGALVVAIDQGKAGWAENITLRNNIIHDSYNNDLLKIYSGARFVTIESNLFYNQGLSEEHIDVNSATDVFIQDNIFFNDYPFSGRQANSASKQYIVIKDSNGDEDGLLASRRVRVRRNIFLNWQGNEKETFVQVGLDGKPYFEAIDVHIENNLFIGNSQNQAGAVFGVKGAQDIYFVNNTIVGDLPAQSYAMRVNITEQNPLNEYIYFMNNIWSDPTGTMGADKYGDENEFSDGDPAETENAFLDTNLYWNGGAKIPDGDFLSPLSDDLHYLVANPLLETNHTNLVLPHWSGAGFVSGSSSIRQEFIRLVRLYGSLPGTSPAINQANPAYAPPDDILRRPRRGLPDLGAYER